MQPRGAIETSQGWRPPAPAPAQGAASRTVAARRGRPRVFRGTGNAPLSSGVTAVSSNDQRVDRRRRWAYQPNRVTVSATRPLATKLLIRDRVGRDGPRGTVTLRTKSLSRKARLPCCAASKFAPSTDGSRLASSGTIALPAAACCSARQMLVMANRSRQQAADTDL